MRRERPGEMSNSHPLRQGCKLRLPGLACGGLLSSTAAAAAHGLGERYELPLPLDLYLVGAAVTVALSFLILALFARTPPGANARSSLAEGWHLPVPPGASVLVLMVRGASIALFAMLVLAGLIGSPDPFKNPLPVSVWVLGWVGIAYLCALFGNVWALVNPWDNIFRLAEWLVRRIRGGRPLRPVLSYPPALGPAPAVLLYFAFAWMELVWPARDKPAMLATVILAYCAITWTGMAMFGRRIWLHNGEFLAVAFGVLSRFAVIGEQPGRDGSRLTLRWPSTGLLVDKPVPPALSAFVLLMLATVTFDGLLETPLWAGLSAWALGAPVLQAAAAYLGLTPYVLVATMALIVFPLIFAALYLLVIAIMRSASAGTSAGTFELACPFVLALVPIAIGYHLAHYLPFLLLAGQFIIPIASDPLALGWNLFGTRLYLIDFSVIGARAAWYASLLLIVGGHVIAVWLAHVQAGRRFTADMVLRTQLPMVALMIGYTAVSLWILAQPIVTDTSF